MEELSRDWPVAAVWVFFLLGSTARGGALHWVGRRVRRFDHDHRGLAERPLVLRAERVVSRVGAPAVTLSFLTVGVQSAVNVASGLLRMPWRHYVPALVVGAALWATVYTTVGMAVVYAVLGRLPGWWLLAAATAVAAVLLLTRLARAAVGSRAGTRDPAPHPAGSTHANGTRSTSRPGSRTW